MGIEAIYPRKRGLSTSSDESKKYLYLLKGLAITVPDQVWSTDITYIRMNRGFMYLVAIMDRYSRYVLSWEISNTLDVSFCIQVLNRALPISRLEIFNSDQGSRFTSSYFTGMLEGADIQISMDGIGRVFDNIFIERLWRTVKSEEVYIHSYEMARGVKDSLNRYFRFYNAERLRESLGYKTPQEIYSRAKNCVNEHALAIHLKEPQFLS